MEEENNWFVSESNYEYKNSVVDKSFKFAIRIIKFYKILIERENKYYPLFKQLLRSGTSIGANITEAQSAPSKKDFINKLNIGLKEANETKYWIELLKETELINEKEYLSVLNDCTELIKLLTSIIKTSKENL
ncbi:MAG: four helix bundle protein [Ignavibacteriales bacterium CG_4_9_14_3_um_filter_34_10]|nr:MAG: four helix bundle protein [Ignavibacteriales bacterium CG_4_9_14_3_um_filter_34_10]